MKIVKQTNADKAVITMKVTGNYIKIYINGLIHLQIPYDNETKLSVHTWRYGSKYYEIQFTNANNGKVIEKAGYTSRQIWENILKLYDENIS